VVWRVYLGYFEVISDGETSYLQSKGLIGKQQRESKVEG